MAKKDRKVDSTVVADPANDLLLPVNGQTLDEYRETVERLADARSPIIFQNDSPDHAAAVIETIIRHSKKEVFVYDKDLSSLGERSSTFYGTLIEHVLLSGRIFRLVIEPDADGLSAGAGILSRLALLAPGAMDVRVQSDEFRNEIGRLCKRLKIDDTVHYAVGDSRMFRLEFPSGARKAYCGFNFPSMALELRTPFEKAFDTCKPYFV